MLNKDKYTSDNVQAAWEEHCLRHVWCNGCPYFQGMHFGERNVKMSCFIRWLYGEAENDKKETNDEIEKLIKDWKERNRKRSNNESN